MDMSVTVGAAGERAERIETGRASRSPNSSDLDGWLEKVETLGELKRITAQVDPDLEAATITYLVGSQKSPALLFENIKGHPGHRAIYNMIGCNLSRFCITIGSTVTMISRVGETYASRTCPPRIAPSEVPTIICVCTTGFP